MLVLRWMYDKRFNVQRRTKSYGYDSHRDANV
jgi:hypothetical protein